MAERKTYSFDSDANTIRIGGRSTEDIYYSFPKFVEILSNGEKFPKGFGLRRLAKALKDTNTYPKSDGISDEPRGLRKRRERSREIIEQIGPAFVSRVEGDIAAIRSPHTIIYHS